MRRAESVDQRRDSRDVFSPVRVSHASHTYWSVKDMSAWCVNTVGKQLTNPLGLVDGEVDAVEMEPLLSARERTVKQPSSPIDRRET